MADTFALDTSGAVYVQSPHITDRNSKVAKRWSDLTPFAQGYIEAVFRELEPILVATGEWKGVRRGVAFSELAPEALAAALADCESRRGLMVTDSRQLGRWFWERRQRGEYPSLPPLTPILSDDGLIRFKEQG